MIMTRCRGSAPADRPATPRRAPSARRGPRFGPPAPPSARRTRLPRTYRYLTVFPPVPCFSLVTCPERAHGLHWRGQRCAQGLCGLGAVPCAMSSGAPDEPARPRSSAARRQWYLAAGVVAGVALLAGTGAVLITVSPAPATRTLAAGCGLVTCGARLPASVTRRAAGERDLHPGR